MTTILSPAPVLPDPEPGRPDPVRPHWLVRVLAAGCAFAATPFGAPVQPHAVAALLHAEPRR